MKERGILFDGPRVRQILDGSKTSTMRLVANQKVLDSLSDSFVWDGPMDQGEWELSKCPWGQPGDRLWVRETFYCDHCFADDYEYTSKKLYVGKELSKLECEAEWRGENSEHMYYRADVPSGRFRDAGYWGEPGGKWTPSIHMPRWASRINLEITKVEIKRIQDGGDRSFWGEEKWAENPWAWVIHFKVIK